MSNKHYGLQKSTPKSTNWRWLYIIFLGITAICCASWATQTVAAAFGYHSALGSPLFIADSRPIYNPFAILQWASKFPEHNTFIEYYITIGQAFFIVPQFIVLAYWLTSRKLKGNTTLQGSADWATEAEIKEMGYFEGTGVYVGGWIKKYSSRELCKRYIIWIGLFCSLPVILVWSLLFRVKKAHAYAQKVLTRPAAEKSLYLRHNGPEHIICFMPTRSGKGVGLILPTLLSWLYSTLNFDIKGENWALTAGWRKSIGQKVLRFDPSDASGSGASFNPLEELRIDTLYAVQDVQNLALMLVDPEGKGLSDHWTKAAFAFFSGIILHCCITTLVKQDKPATLYDLTLMLADENRTTEELLQEMLETDHSVLLNQYFKNATGTHEAHTFIASSAREMLNKDEKEASGVLSSALVNMALYRDPIVAINTSKCDFRIHDLMNHDTPVNLYLVVSPGDIDRVRPLMRLILDMIVRRICSKMEFSNGSSVANYKHKLLFMLDEFTALGKLPIMEKAIGYIAGYGGKFYIIVQDLSQLNSVYGKDNALMANCHTRVAAAPNTTETAKILSEMAGKTTVVETKTSLSGSRIGSMKNASLSVNETARPLLTPDECMRLPSAIKDTNGKILKAGHILIFTAGKNPIYGEQILYFRDPIFSARSKIPVPGLSSRFPAGITDSIYYPRPKDWYSPISEEKRLNTPKVSGENYEDYFN